MRKPFATLCCATLTVLCVPAAGAQEFAQRSALIFAVDKYAATGVPQLEFAERDARRLAERLEAQGFTVTKFTGTGATRGEVVRQLLLAQERLRPQDTFVLYYAGHGVRRASNGQVYWLNVDGDPNRPDIDGLRLSHLIELVREIGAGRKLVLLDHCYAGDVPDASASGDGGRSTAEGSPVLERPREAFPLEFANNIEQARTVEGKDTSLFVIAASRGVALEDPNLMHGFFTAVLLEALAGPGADTQSNDGAVSMFELMTYVEEQVKSKSGSRQAPYTFTPKSGNLTSGLNWQPFIRALNGAEVDLRQQRYIERLRQWTNQQLITPEVQILSETLLQRWRSAPTALSPTDEQAIAEIRLLIDTPPLVDDAQIAAELARRMRFLLAP